MQGRRLTATTRPQHTEYAQRQQRNGHRRHQHAPSQPLRRLHIQWAALLNPRKRRAHGRHQALPRRTLDRARSRQRVEGRQELRHVGPLARRLGQQAMDQLGKFRGHVRPSFQQPSRLCMQMLIQNLNESTVQWPFVICIDSLFRHKWRSATQHFIKNHTERICICLFVTIFCIATLLGRHITWCANQHPGCCHLDGICTILWPNDAGNTKVQNLDALATGDIGIGGQHQVIGLQIAVDHTDLVYRSQSRCNLSPPAHDFLFAAAAAHALAQRLAGDEFHAQIGLAARQVAVVKDLHDPRVADAVRDLRFIDKAHDDLHIISIFCF